MASDFSELSSIQIDALVEIGNIGAGNAATALAQMINTKIDMTVPKVNILPFKDVPELIGGADSHVVGIYLNVTGGAPANMLFILPIAKASLLCDMLFARNIGETEPGNFGEMEMSALMELGNVLATTYLNSLAMFTQLTFIPSVPGLSIDMAGAIIDAILAQFGEVADYVFVLETNFKRKDTNVEGHFFMLPEPGSLDTVLTALGVSF